MQKTLVLGVGNILHSDDGVGPAVIKKLMGTVPKGDCPTKQCLPDGRIRGQSPFGDSPHYIDGGTDGLALLDILRDYSRVIIIDAVNMNEAPGTIRVFSPDEAKIKIKQDALSTHGFGLAEVLKLVEKLEIKTDIKIIGIQPETIEFGGGLSNTIQNKLSEIISLVLKSI